MRSTERGMVSRFFPPLQRNYMKTIKKIGIACGVFFLVVIAGGLLLEFVIDLTPYLPQVTRPLSNALHRNVEIGKLSHTILRGPGASLQQVTVFEPDQKTVWASAAEIMAKLRLLPLLSKRIEVVQIALTQPNVVLKRGKNGLWNIADFIGQQADAAESPMAAKATPVPKQPADSEQPPSQTTKTPANAPSPQTPAVGSTLAIDAIQLSRGTIRVIDEMTDVTTEISNVNATVKGVSVNAPIRFDISADLQGRTLGQIHSTGKISQIPANGTVQNAEMDVTTTLKDIDLAHFQPYLQFAHLQKEAPLGKLNATLQLAGSLDKQITSTGNVSVDDVRVDVSGNVAQAATNPALDLTISSKEFSWENVIQLLPPNAAKPLQDLGLTGKGTLNVQPKGALDQLAISGEFDLSQSGMRASNVFAKPAALAAMLKFDMTLMQDAVDIKMFNVSIGNVTLSATGTVSRFSKPIFDMQITSTPFPLPDMLALFPVIAELKQNGQPALKTDGMASLTAGIKGAADDLNINATVNLDQGAVAYADFFQKAAAIPGNIAAEVRLKKDSVSINRAVVNLGEFQLTAHGEVNHFNEPELDIAVETNLFDLAAMFGHFPMLTAQVPKELRLDGLGKIAVKSVGSVKNLAISGMVDMTKGEILFGDVFNKPKDIPGSIEFDTTITPDSVALKQVQINLNDVLFDVTGAISGLKQKAMLDIRLKSNQFALNQLLPFSGLEMHPTGITEFSMQVKGAVADFTPDSIVALDLRCQDVGLLLPAFGKPVNHLNLVAALRGQTLSLKQLSASIGESSLKGDATILDPFTTPDVAFALESDYLNADEFLKAAPDAHTPQARFYRSGSRSPFRVVAETTVTSPPVTVANHQEWPLSHLKARGTLSIKHGIVKQVEFANLRSDVMFANQVLNLENMLFELYDGTYQGRVKFDLSAPTPTYEFESKLMDVDANRLLTASVSAKDIVYGLLFANAAIAGKGFSAEQLAQHLSGSGTIAIGAGKFTSFNIWPDIAQIFELLGTVGNSDALLKIGSDIGQFPAETNFSRFEATFNLEEGKGGHSEVLLEVPEQEMHIALLMNGEFGLDLSLDLLGKIRFAPESKYYNDIKKAFRDFEQDDGSIELPFPIPIGGTLLKPTINMKTAQKSLQKFAEKMARQAVTSEVGKQVEKELGKAGKDLLKQIFK
ncbi:hypothetical protein U14_01401 [Candidatus Moduliflexus flocculans]|uniref:AsmA domain-containing protein n=1 Tax=Candidatus Moduliflexus flocculans TaxID=1499966 RepID=A0A0S6VYU6_9BACT|nr:hypothetical protein U14_01401 [Candidatus Moduliflexus flocculans]